jgi:hypothetical protein
MSNVHYNQRIFLLHEIATNDEANKGVAVPNPDVRNHRVHGSGFKFKKKAGVD